MFFTDKNNDSFYINNRDIKEVKLYFPQFEEDFEIHITRVGEELGTNYWLPEEEYKNVCTQLKNIK